MTADCGWFRGSRSWSRMQMKRTRKNRLDYRNLSTGTSIWDPRKRQCLISLWRVKDHLTIHLNYRCLTAHLAHLYILFIGCVVSTLQDNLGRMLRESGNFEGAEFYFKDWPLRLGHKSGSLVFLGGHPCDWDCRCTFASQLLEKSAQSTSTPLQVAGPSGRDWKDVWQRSCWQLTRDHSELRLDAAWIFQSDLHCNALRGVTHPSSTSKQTQKNQTCIAA